MVYSGGQWRGDPGAQLGERSLFRRGQGGHLLPVASDKRSLRFFSFDTGKTREIIRINVPFTNVAVSPDERWLAFPKADALESDLMLVENFR